MTFKKKNAFYIGLLSCLAIVAFSNIAWQSSEELVLKGSKLDLRWKKGEKGWRITNIAVKGQQKWIQLPNPVGNYTLLYTPVKPDTVEAPLFDKDGKKSNFPEPIYKYITSHWSQVTQSVQLNTAGEAIHFYPDQITKNKDQSLNFSKEIGTASINALWQIDPKFTTDITVKITLKANKDGYYSIASPTLATVSNEQLSWGLMPGYFQGATLEKDLVKAYAYGQGIPDRPIVVRERTASTLSPLISSKNGVTMAVIPEPGTGRNPWSKDKNTHKIL